MRMKVNVGILLLYLTALTAIIVGIFFLSHKLQPIFSHRVEVDKPHMGTMDIRREEKKDNINNYSAFKGLNMDKDNIRIKFEGKDLHLTLPIYVSVNRYYLPLTEMVDKLGGSSRIDGMKIIVDLHGKEAVIDTGTMSFSKGNDTFKLWQKPILSNGITYISLFDITKLFDLKTDWDTDGKVISLFWNRDKLVQRNRPQEGKQALIRLEDITATWDDHYPNADALEKLRIVADYLHAQNVPFGVAWIPRFIDPRPRVNQDNDLSKQYSPYNTDFLFTLDYMIDKGGTIGLHGYTHQYGNGISVGGVEFGGSGIMSTDEYADERINQAINTARKLNIPYGFFEAPHYQINSHQLRVVEKYFDNIYQYYPGAINRVYTKQLGNRTIKYIPAPLDYIKGKDDTNNMINKINNLKDDVLGSFFYHPFREFDDIKIVRDSGGYPSYDYSNTSILHQVLNAFDKKGFRFVSIYEVK